ncbi:unnamed protein product, partial [Discosporangium mesarthrocarpum]
RSPCPFCLGRVARARLSEHLLRCPSLKESRSRRRTILSGGTLAARTSLQGAGGDGSAPRATVPDKRHRHSSSGLHATGANSTLTTTKPSGHHRQQQRPASLRAITATPALPSSPYATTARGYTS